MAQSRSMAHRRPAWHVLTFSAASSQLSCWATAAGCCTRLRLRVAACVRALRRSTTAAVHQRVHPAEIDPAGAPRLDRHCQLEQTLPQVSLRQGLLTQAALPGVEYATRLCFRAGEACRCVCGGTAHTMACDTQVRRSGSGLAVWPRLSPSKAPPPIEVSRPLYLWLVQPVGGRSGRGWSCQL